MISEKKRYLIIRFIGLAFLSTWIPWIIAVVSGQKQGDILATILIALGGIGPTIAALIMLYKTNGLKELKKDYWSRVVNFKAIKARYYLIIIFLLPIAFILSILIASTIEGGGRQIIEISNSTNSIIGILFFPIFILFFGPIPEELGWRGVGLDLLSNKYNKLKASLILASIWAVWHTPLFFISGTYQNTEMLNPFGIFIYVGTIFPNTFIMTWLYYKTDRMILSAILYHFMINYTGSIIEISKLTQFSLLCVLSLITLISVIKEKNFWSKKVNSQKKEIQLIKF